MGALQETAHTMNAAIEKWTDLIWNPALDVLFPIRCLGCSVPGEFICAPCAELMPRLEEPFCEICANPGTDGICGWCLDREPHIDQIRVPYLYLPSSPIYKAITLLKYRGIRALAPELANLLAQYIEDSPARFDCIVPVVSHPSRIRRRGYSQAALMAADLGRRLDIPVLEDALTRVRNAPSQLSTRSREQRWNNVQGNFASQHDLSGLVILLVDDLVTTGSTAASAARALKSAGALGVFCIAVARATSRPQRV